MTVRAATLDDLSQLASVLAEAFREDPFHRWLLPTEAEWSRNSERLWKAALVPRIRDATVFTTDEIEGVALWYSPERGQASAIEAAKMVAVTLPVLWRRFFLVARGTRQMEASHPESPHWYLFSLGTAPAHRGKGIGSALLEPVLDRCDSEEIPAYLESTNEKNIPLYQRHGFEIQGEIHLPKGPTIWPMLRRARAAQQGVERGR